MNALIIEDEPHAARRLESLLQSIDPTVCVIQVLDSVEAAVAWFRTRPLPDLIFMDIQLADGLSFTIFDQCSVQAPVIFTTAYDQYAVKAFKVNGVDYILKPIDPDELKEALHKVRRYAAPVAPNHDAMLQQIGKAMEMLTRRYKTRFVIKIGERLHTIEVSDILFFYSQEKVTFCHTSDGRNHILDFTLEQLEEMTDPNHFHRVNRKYLISARSIEDIVQYSNSRLRLMLRGTSDNDIIVARERVQKFRSWLDQ